MLAQMRQYVVETAKVERLGQPLRDRLSVGIADRGRKIHDVTHNRRIRALYQDDGHFICYGLQAILQDLKPNAVDCRLCTETLHLAASRDSITTLPGGS